MKYVKLGKTGLQVSRICLGMMSFGDPDISKWTLPLDQAKPIVNRALDLGINFFDTANVYSFGKSEEITGEILSGYREEIVLATKVFFPLKGFNVQSKPNQSGLSRYHIQRAVDDSLKRLKTKTNTESSDRGWKGIAYRSKFNVCMAVRKKFLDGR
jgi:aryl-alcohol dehydrogenase-like predicted oxidoreductase